MSKNSNELSKKIINNYYKKPKLESIKEQLRREAISKTEAKKDELEVTHNVQSIFNMVELTREFRNYIKTAYKGNDAETKIKFLELLIESKMNPTCRLSQAITEPGRGKTTFFKAFEKAFLKLYIEEIVKSAKVYKKIEGETTLQDIYDEDVMDVNVEKLSPAVRRLFERKGYPLGFGQSLSDPERVFGTPNVKKELDGKPVIETNHLTLSRADTVILDETKNETNSQINQSISLYNHCESALITDSKFAKHKTYGPSRYNTTTIINTRNTTTNDNRTHNQLGDSFSEDESGREALDSRVTLTFIDLVTPWEKTPTTTLIDNDLGLNLWEQEVEGEIKETFGLKNSENEHRESVESFNETVYEILKRNDGLESFLQSKRAMLDVQKTLDGSKLQPAKIINNIAHDLLTPMIAVKNKFKNVTDFDNILKEFSKVSNMSKKNYNDLDPKAKKLADQMLEVQRILNVIDSGILDGSENENEEERISEFRNFFTKPDDTTSTIVEQSNLKASKRTEEFLPISYFTHNLLKEEGQFSEKSLDQKDFLESFFWNSINNTYVRQTLLKHIDVFLLLSLIKDIEKKTNIIGEKKEEVDASRLSTPTILNQLGLDETKKYDAQLNPLYKLKKIPTSGEELDDFNKAYPKSDIVEHLNSSNLLGKNFSFSYELKEGSKTISREVIYLKSFEEGDEKTKKTLDLIDNILQWNHHNKNNVVKYKNNFGDPIKNEPLRIFAASKTSKDVMIPVKVTSGLLDYLLNQMINPKEVDLTWKKITKEMIDKIKKEYDLELLGTFLREFYEDRVSGYYSEVNKSEDRSQTNTGKNLFVSKYDYDNDNDALEKSKKNFTKGVEPLIQKKIDDKIYLKNNKITTPIILSDDVDLSKENDLKTILNLLSLSGVNSKDIDKDPITKEMMKGDWYNGVINMENVSNIKPQLLRLSSKEVKNITFENSEKNLPKFFNKDKLKEIKIRTSENPCKDIPAWEIENLLIGAINNEELSLTDLEKKKILRITNNLINGGSKSDKNRMLEKIKEIMVKDKVSKIAINYKTKKLKKDKPKVVNTSKEKENFSL